MSRGSDSLPDDRLQGRRARGGATQQHYVAPASVLRRPTQRKRGKTWQNLAKLGKTWQNVAKLGKTLKLGKGSARTPGGALQGPVRYGCAEVAPEMEDGDDGDTTPPWKPGSSALLPLVAPDDDLARQPGELDSGSSTPISRVGSVGSELGGALLPVSAPAGGVGDPPVASSPFFREAPKQTTAERDAMAIANLLRAGSGGASTSQAPPLQSGSAAQQHAARYGRQVGATPAEVDAALGGLPELLSRAGLTDEVAVEDEPFGMKRVTTKKHMHEDDTCATWKRRRKHFFIFSAAGKPIFARYGDENALAGFMV